MAKLFTEQMKEARKRRGLTQEDLAKLMIVSRSTVSHWEIGRKMPEKEFLERLEQVLEEEFIVDQEEGSEVMSEEAIESLEVPSIEENSSVIPAHAEKQISLKVCIAAICAAILLTSLVSWFVLRNWTSQDVERINFVVSVNSAAGDPLEYQGYIELEYQKAE